MAEQSIYDEPVMPDWMLLADDWDRYDEELMAFVMSEDGLEVSGAVDVVRSLHLGVYS